MDHSVSVCGLRGIIANKNLSLSHGWAVTIVHTIKITQIALNILIAEAKIHKFFHLLNTARDFEED